MQKYNLGFINDEDLFAHVLDDVMQTQEYETVKNTVFTELNQISPNLIKSLYLLSFSKYEGFETLDI